MAGTAATPQILLVEDEFAIRSALSDALRQAGLEPVEVVSAEEALGLVGRESIRLVITDLEMLGGLGGLDFVLWLSKVRPSLPVIVTSRNRAERMKLGEIPVFEKPYRPGAVVEQAKELLRQH
jgi:DNA-binding NtrC family response regulator